MKKGVPSIVQQTLIRPPSSRLGPLSQSERQAIIDNSPVFGVYDTVVDRESAYEILKKQAEEKAKREEEQRAEEDRQREEKGRMKRGRTGFTLPDFGRDDRPSRRSRRSTTRRRSNRQSVAEAAMKSVARSVASSLGKALVRGILGSLKSGR